MKNNILTSLVLLFVGTWSAIGQCDTIKIPKTSWNVVAFDSEEPTGEGTNNGRAIHGIDGDTTTYWHTQWQAAQPNYPHHFVIDLGSSHAVNGLSILSRHNSGGGKTKDYELYLSNDGINWGLPQVSDVMVYNSIGSPSQRGTVFFGAVDAQYLKVVFNSNYDNNKYIVVSEFDVYEYTGTGCTVSGQQNQTITLNTIPKKETNSPDFQITGLASSGLSLNYSIISGPATINGNTISLTGNAGTVTVTAEQTGDANYYANQKTISFDVVDLSTYFPTITTKLTDAFSIQMPTLDPYLIYSNATIDEPAFLSIDKIQYVINNSDTIHADSISNYYQGWWTPSSFGAHTVQIIATGSNGNQSKDTLNINVTNTISDTIIATFDGAVIDMGTIGSQWYYGSYKLPQSVGAFDSLVANFHISCPSVAGGCDDWDRLGWVEYKAPNGEWHELFRYITPYGKACHQSLDVTDYASLLQGNIELRMYIETWGTGGWKLDLDIEYYKGTPTYKYSTIQEVWDGDYSFGNMNNLQPVEDYNAKFQDNISASTLRLVTTGHGWGSNNTNNAAEFYHATHNIKVDNAATFVQDLWSDCNPNPAGCSNQAGTWTYDRAGWCPGSMGKVYKYDLTPYKNNDSIMLNYIFQESYKDFCNPSNPNCVSGVTCADCNASYNPYYHVGSYQINFSNNPISLNVIGPKVDDRINMNVYPNPNKGLFMIDLDNDNQEIFISIIDISGKVQKTYYFENTTAMKGYLFDATNLMSGTYFVKVQSKKGFKSSKIIID